MTVQEICDAVSAYLGRQGHRFAQVLTGDDRRVVFAGRRAIATIELGLGSKVKAEEARQVVVRLAQTSERKSGQDRFVVLPSVSRGDAGAVAVFEGAGLRVLTVGPDGGVVPL
jgi:hypothetical protein